VPTRAFAVKKSKLRKWRKKWLPDENNRIGQRLKQAEHLMEEFRHHPTSTQLDGGELLSGHIVGARDSRFSLVEFGLRADVAFPKEELLGTVAPGSVVAFPLIRLEDDFKEAEMDYSRATQLPAIVAERTQLMVELLEQKNPLQFVRGRVVSADTHGYQVRVLGHDMFLPLSHALGVPTPAVGRAFTFAILKLDVMVDSGGAGSQGAKDMPSVKAGQSENRVQFNGVLSSYVSNVLILGNLIANEDAWEASGGGTPEERLAYLRMLTNLIWRKSSSFRDHYRVTTQRGSHDPLLVLAAVLKEPSGDKMAEHVRDNLSFTDDREY